jgi:hypothetical protein
MVHWPPWRAIAVFLPREQRVQPQVAEPLSFRRQFPQPLPQQGSSLRRLR